MKTSIITFLAVITLAFSAMAQTWGPWSPWVTVYQTGAHFVQVSFKMGPHCENYSYYRTNSNYSIEGGTVSFNYDYIDCDGHTQTERLTVLLDKPGIDFSSVGTWFIGSKVVTQYRDVVFYQPPVINASNNSIPGSNTAGDNQTSGSSRTTYNNNNAGAGTANNTPATNTYTPAQQQTQQYINAAQNPSGDAITQAAALGSARINAMVRGGSTYQQRQQIQQEVQQQSQANSNAISSSLGQIAGIWANYANQKAEQRQREEERKAQEEQEAQQAEREEREEDRQMQQERDNAEMAYYNKALAENNAGNYNDAISDFTNAIKYQPDVSILYYHRANSEAQISKYDDAKADCDKAISLYPDSADYYLLRGYIAYTGLHDYASAMSDLNRADLLKPNTAVIINLKNDAEKALDAAKKAAESEKAITDYLQKGNQAFRESNYTGAVDVLNQAIQLYPQDARLYAARGYTKTALLKYESAIYDLGKAILIDPKSWSCYPLIADAYDEVGSFQLSIDNYTKAMAFGNMNSQELAYMHNGCAQAEYQLHLFKKAVDDCTTAINLNQSRPDSAIETYAYFTRGKAYFKKLNNRQAGISDFNQVLQLSSSKDVLFIFSNFYLGKSGAALQMMRDKLSVTTGKGMADVALDDYNMACLLSLMNRRTEAIVYLRKAISAGYSKKYALNDDDFDNIKNTPAYIHLVKN